ncbi:MAG: prepilin-type N-terminal cleavage/methylation domain-containing protein [Betaproteobacteria bacterium]|nr:prepilin-type N-terminal cleavage/methylation domain-containing protein [Betaproteobacteria bacterium]
MPSRCAVDRPQLTPALGCIGHGQYQQPAVEPQHPNGQPCGHGPPAPVGRPNRAPRGQPRRAAAPLFTRWRHSGVARLLKALGLAAFQPAAWLRPGCTGRAGRVLVCPAVWETAARGLTLLEMMAVLAIAAVLAATAYPSWRDQLHKGRRTDAVAALGSLQLAQEKHRWAHGRYAEHTALLGLPSHSPAAHYDLTVEHADRAGYTLVATARAGSPQQSDLPCERLGVALQAGVTLELAARAGQPLEPDPDRRCWAR